jgi:SAM-dependent methyltransferase
MTTYALGTSAPEIARLDAQATTVAVPTRQLLRSAGIGPGMRVLDLATGLGPVAFEVAELVGETGAVVGIDQSPALLAVAEERRRAAGLENVRFEEADVRTYQAEAPFDAIVGRLILFHLPDRAEVLEHFRASLRPGGLIVALDFDCGTCRTEPPLPLVETVTGWFEAAFRAAGADPRVGTQLQALLTAAGFRDVVGYGMQVYFAPGAPIGPALLAAVTRSLGPAIVRLGLATEDEIAALRPRLEQAVAEAGAIVMPPCLAGAWGRL